MRRAGTRSGGSRTHGIAGARTEKAHRLRAEAEQEDAGAKTQKGESTGSTPPH